MVLTRFAAVLLGWTFGLAMLGGLASQPAAAQPYPYAPNYGYGGAPPNTYNPYANGSYGYNPYANPYPNNYGYNPYNQPPVNNQNAALAGVLTTVLSGALGGQAAPYYGNGGYYGGTPYGYGQPNPLNSVLTTVLSGVINQAVRGR